MVGITGFLLGGRCRTNPDAARAMWSLMAGEAVAQVELYRDEYLACAFDRPDEASGRSNHADEDILVWLDGDIYDFGTRMVRSREKGNSAAVVSDLYRRNGLDFFKTVDGIFAAVVYDRAKQQIHLINDRYGLRQIYIWYPPGGGLSWASKTRAFLAAPSFAPRIDRSALSDFIEIGYMTEDRTWFDGVSLLPSASLLTWDIRAGRASKQRYWWWDQIKPYEGRINEDEIAEELGSRFVRAVAKRVAPNERVGLGLSGGLDSRAILAAMPSYCDPVHSITFGVDGCEDRTLAARAAALRASENHQFALDEGNWLMPRVGGVWLSDGQHDLMHMHGMEAAPLILQHFQVDMSGFGGDGTIGGSYLRADALDCSITADRAARFMGCDPHLVEIGSQYSLLNKLDYHIMQNRVRRFLYGAVALSESLGLPCRLPFFDNALIELVFSLPDKLRYRSRAYRKMLLRQFPAYFNSIPWQKTGVPISHSDLSVKLINYGWRARRKLSVWTGGLLVNPYSSLGYTDYNKWLRTEPARSFFESLFNNRDAIYPAYLPQATVKSDWERHLAGENNAQALCRYATFEIWLRQIFENKMRP